MNLGDFGTATITCRNPFEIGQSGLVVSFVKEGTEGAYKLYIDRVLLHAFCYTMFTKWLDVVLNAFRGTRQEMDFSQPSETLPGVAASELSTSEGFARMPVDTKLQQGLVNLLEFTPQPDEPNENDLGARLRYRFPE